MLTFAFCFPSQLDIVSLVVSVQVPMYLQDLESERKRLFEDSMNGPTPDVPIQDIFALYRRTKTLMGMYKAFVPKWAFILSWHCLVPD